MYKELTFDAILERMLKRVAAKYDKREASVIWDALAPASVEFQNLYVIIQGVLTEMFADTATRNFLIKHCADKGITPKPASYAIVKGKFTPSTLEIPIGARFSFEDFNYKVKDKISNGLYHLECETIGSAPNGQIGKLIPIDYINGLQSAEILEMSILGEDEEATETLRERYFSSLQSGSFGGNLRDYRDKILSLSGIGGVKVYGGVEWNGGGTVKCVISNSDYGVPDEDLVDSVQTYIDPQMNHGDGKGEAPIGHIVTVVAAYITEVNITTSLVYQSGYSWATVKDNVKTAVDEYLASLNSRWDKLDRIHVRISHVENAILNVPGVLDVQGTTLNGKEENLAVDRDSLVTRGTINGDT